MAYIIDLPTGAKQHTATYSLYFYQNKYNSKYLEYSWELY